MLDLLILGAGPAGLALAAQARRRGLQVAVMAPDPMRPWTQTLCAWTDELPDVPLSARWSRVRVKVDSEREFDRSYGLLDNRALQAKLAEGIDLVRGTCTGVDHFADYSEINGVRARLVVDAEPLAGRLSRHLPAYGLAPVCRHSGPDLGPRSVELLRSRQRD